MLSNTEIIFIGFFFLVSYYSAVLVYGAMYWRTWIFVYLCHVMCHAYIYSCHFFFFIIVIILTKNRQSRLTHLRGGRGSRVWINPLRVKSISFSLSLLKKKTKIKNLCLRVVLDKFVLFYLWIVFSCYILNCQIYRCRVSQIHVILFVNHVFVLYFELSSTIYARPL